MDTEWWSTLLHWCHSAGSPTVRRPTFWWRIKNMPTVYVHQLSGAPFVHTIRDSQTFSTFKQHLKTHLFQTDFNITHSEPLHASWFLCWLWRYVSWWFTYTHLHKHWSSSVSQTHHIQGSFTPDAVRCVAAPRGTDGRQAARRWHSTTPTPTRTSSPTSSQGSSRERRRVVELAIKITSGNRASDVSARILARMSVSVSVSASWNSSLNEHGVNTVWTNSHGVAMTWLLPTAVRFADGGAYIGTRLILSASRGLRWLRSRKYDVASDIMTRNSPSSLYGST